VGLLGKGNNWHGLHRWARIFVVDVSDCEVEIVLVRNIYK